MSCSRKGLLRTFQIAHEFGSMTVRENLMMVPAHQSGESAVERLFPPRRRRRRRTPHPRKGR